MERAHGTESPFSLSKGISLTFIFLALILLIVAHSFPVSETDAEVKLLSTKGVLKGDLYLYGFDVKAGSKGGMMGGQDVRNERFYLQGPGPDLPERLGILMNSYKDMSYTITAETYDPARDEMNTAEILVETHIDRIPFWAHGVKEEITVTLSLNRSAGVEKVDIEKIRIESWDSWVEDDDEYTDKKVLLEKKVADVLTEREPELTYRHSIEYSSGDNRTGIVVRVECEMTDVNGRVDDDPREPFKSDGYPNPHHVYGVSHSKAAKVLLMVLAFPMFVAVGLLSILAAVGIFRGKRPVKTLFACGILTGAALFFFWWGIETLTGLVSVAPSLAQLTDRYFSWNWPVYLPIPAALSYFGAGAMMMVVSREDGDEEEGEGGGQGQEQEQG